MLNTTVFNRTIYYIVYILYMSNMINSIDSDDYNIISSPNMYDKIEKIEDGVRLSGLDFWRNGMWER